MHKTFLRITALALSFGFLGAQAQNDDQGKALFDGTSLEGWEQLNGTATYKVEDGVIVGTTTEGSPNSFLCSVEEFGDFELTFETKVDDGLNSGVQIRSRQKVAADIDQNAKKKKNEQPGRFFGPQVEVEKSPGQAGWIYGEATGLGWLSTAPGEKAEHSHVKNGEWNKFRVVAKGSNIQTWVNGQKVADLTHEEVFKTHPKGKIGLQVHGIKKGTGPFQARWRNIRIKAIK